MFLQIVFIISCILTQHQGAVVQPIIQKNPPINLSRLISDYIDDVKSNCNIIFSQENINLCSQPIVPVSKKISFYFDSQHYVCMALYDSIYRICGKKNEEKLELEQSVQNMGNGNVSDICNKMRSALNVSMSTKNEIPLGWIRILNENLKDDNGCRVACIKGNNALVHPVCEAVMLANDRLRKSEQLPTTTVIPSRKPPIGKAESLVNTSNEDKNVKIGGAFKNPTNTPLSQNSQMGVGNVAVQRVDGQGETDTYNPSQGDFPNVSHEEFTQEELRRFDQESPVDSENLPSFPKMTENELVPTIPDTHAEVEILEGKAKPKTIEAKPVATASTPERNIKVEIPQTANSESLKGDVKSELHKHPQLKKPVHQSPKNGTIKSQVDTKEANKDPLVSPVLDNTQIAPPKAKVEHLPAAAEHIKPENVEKNVEGSSKTMTDSEPKKTVAEKPQTQNSDNVVISADNNNANDNGSNEDDLNLGDQDTVGDIETSIGNENDKTLPPNEDLLKKDENMNTIDVDDEGDLPVINGVDKSQVVYGNRDKFVNAEDSHFFAYFMAMVIICIIGYLVFHNKQKILALALEGRSRRSTRRRPNTSGYRKLDSNLEEAVTSTCSTSVTHVIY